MKKCDLESSFI